MDAIVGFASLYVKHGDPKYALQLLFFTLNHPSTIQETKARAERLSTEVRNRLSDQEIEFARACSEDATLDSIVAELLRRETFTD